MIHEVAEAAGEVENRSVIVRERPEERERGQVSGLAVTDVEVREELGADPLRGALVAQLHPVLRGQRVDLGEHRGDLTPAGFQCHPRPQSASERQAEAGLVGEPERHRRGEGQHLHERIDPTVGPQQPDQGSDVGAGDLRAARHVVLNVDMTAA